MRELFDEPQETAQPEQTLMTTELRETPNPMSLLAMAVEGKADPDQLDKLLSLQERWERNQAEKAFSRALHAAQSELPVVVRDAENTHTRKKYALLESIQTQAKPVYEKHGFSLSFGEDDCPLEGHKRTVCDVTHTEGHTRRYHLDLPVDKSGSMNAIQGCISTTSYAQRRLLCLIFNITVAGEDHDGVTQGSPITSDQVAELNAIMERIHPDENALARILRFGNVESLDQFPARLFADAKRGLLKTAEQYA